MAKFMDALEDYNRQQMEADAEAAWNDPEMDLIDEGLLPPPEFPSDVLGPWAAWVADQARSVCAPVDWTAVSLLALAGACIGAARKVSPWPSWHEFPPIWVGLIGKPSTGKSPTLAPFIEAGRILEAEEGEAFEPRRREYEAQKEVSDQRHAAWLGTVKKAIAAGHDVPRAPDEEAMPKEPKRPRLIVGDITNEALGVILEGNPRGVLKCHDELSAWFANVGKYGGDELPDYLTFYSGGSHSVDRLNRESIIIRRALVGVLGGIQPDRLGELLLDRVDDGLVSRILPIYPEPAPRQPPPQPADFGVLLTGLRRLRNLPFGTDEDGEAVPVIVPLEEDAVSAFATWWQANKTACEDASGFVQGFLGKGPGTVLRLSLILEMIWWAHSGIIGPPHAVTKAAIDAACRLYEAYFVPMAQRVYAGPRHSRLEVQASELLRHIQRKKLKTVNASEVRRQRLANLRKADEVDKVVRLLCKAGWLRARPSREGDTKGRMKSDYEVNPRLWEPA